MTSTAVRHWPRNENFMNGWYSEGQFGVKLIEWFAYEVFEYDSLIYVAYSER